MQARGVVLVAEAGPGLGLVVHEVAVPAVVRVRDLLPLRRRQVQHADLHGRAGPRLLQDLEHLLLAESTRSHGFADAPGDSSYQLSNFRGSGHPTAAWAS